MRGRRGVVAPKPSALGARSVGASLGAECRRRQKAQGRLLDELGDKAPALVRGDSGCGNEGILLTLDERKQPDLLPLRQTRNVQRLVAWQFSRQDRSRPPPA